MQIHKIEKLMLEMSEIRLYQLRKTLFLMTEIMRQNPEIQVEGLLVTSLYNELCEAIAASGIEGQS